MRSSISWTKNMLGRMEAQERLGVGREGRGSGVGA